MKGIEMKPYTYLIGWSSIDEDWRRKIGEGNTRKVRTQEIKDNLAARNKGRRHSPEAIEKMRQLAQSRKKGY